MYTRVAVIVALIGVAVSLTAATTAGSMTSEPDASGPVEVATLSSASGQHFTFEGSTDRVTASATAGSTDGDIREVFWLPGARPRADQQVCTVWDDTATSPGSPGQSRQPGLALRIAPATDDGRGVKAVTLTQNVYAGATWVFWVDVWSVTDPAQPNFRGVKQFDLFPIVGSTVNPVRPPWHVCARVQGRDFAFKVWTGSDPEPTWDDRTHVFTTRLPAGWDYPGHAGGYIGHLRSGEQSSFSKLATTALEAASPRATPAPGTSRIAPIATPMLGWPTYIG